MMKLKMTLIGASMLLMYGAVGAMETSSEILVPMLIVAGAAVMGTIGALMKVEE